MSVRECGAPCGEDGRVFTIHSPPKPTDIATWTDNYEGSKRLISVKIVIECLALLRMVLKGSACQLLIEKIDIEQRGRGAL